MAKVGLDADVHEVGLYVIVAVAEVVGAGGIVVQQVIVSELSNVGARRRVTVRCVGPQIDQPAEHRQNRFVGDLVLILQRSSNTLLVVVGLVSVGEQLMNVDKQARFFLFLPKYAELAGIEAHIKQAGVK